jgi:hypothetical protein
MDASKGLRFLAAALILISGILHSAVGLSFTGTNNGVLAIDVGFGVIYIVTGIGLFIGKRLFSYLGVIFPLLGGSGGAYEYVTGHSQTYEYSQLMNPLVIAIDVIVILCCCYLLLHKETQPASR